LEFWQQVAWLLASFVGMLLLHYWLNRHIQGMALLVAGHPHVAMWLFFIFFLPGIVLHELSHWLTASLLRVRTKKISIYPQVIDQQHLRLGFIEIARTDPLRSSIIGLAPLLAGTLVVLLIGQAILGLGTLGAVLGSGDGRLIWDSLREVFSRRDFWLWLYMLFAIANAMFPSAADRREWKVVAAYVAGMILLCLILGLLPPLPADLMHLISRLMQYLALAFTIALSVDALMMLVLLPLEAILGWLKGKKVVYS
jgi:hypothetical protein